MEWILSNWYVLIGLFMSLVGMLSYSWWGVVLCFYGVGIMFFKLNILVGCIIIFAISFSLLIYKLLNHYFENKEN